MPRVSSKGLNKKPRTTENRDTRAMEDFEGSEDSDGPLKSHGSSDEEHTFNNTQYGISSLRSEDDLHRTIAEKAFLIYEASGFENGCDLDHWLEAERQIKSMRM